MTEGVQCARPTDTIARAAQRMRDLNIGALPVCGEHDELLGMITDRDIVIRAVADCCDPDSTLVGDVMSPGITFCYDDYDVEDAAHVMENKQIRRIVVLNRDKRMVGIVSLGDLAVDTGNEKMAGSTLEAVSEPSRPQK
jgi:CBS domain-containing protein